MPQNVLTQSRISDLKFVRGVVYDYIAACGPCTLNGLVSDVQVQCTLPTIRVLPVVMHILVDLTRDGMIELYDEDGYDDSNPFDAAWTLA